MPVLTRKNDNRTPVADSDKAAFELSKALDVRTRLQVSGRFVRPATGRQSMLVDSRSLSR